jgi:hypothetical protein
MKVWRDEPVDAIHSALVFLAANALLTLSIFGWLSCRFPGWVAGVGCGAALWCARHSGVVKGRTKR